MKCKYSFCVFLVVVLSSYAHSTQRPSAGSDDESNPFLDMASSFLQEALANQNGGAGGGGAAAGLGGIASLIGNMMQPDGGKANGGIGAAQILSGISSFMANANAGGGGGAGFDPSIIGNVIEMFTGGGGGGDAGSDVSNRQKRANGGQEGIGLDTILNLASAFVNTNKVQGKNNGQDEGFMSFLPMVMDVVNSFTGPEGEKMHEKHKDHAWVLPPFLEKVHVMWDHFSNSELADALWKKSGVHSIFKVS